MKFLPTPLLALSLFAASVNAEPYVAIEKDSGSTENGDKAAGYKFLRGGVQRDLLPKIKLDPTLKEKYGDFEAIDTRAHRLQPSAGSVLMNEKRQLVYSLPLKMHMFFKKAKGGGSSTVVIPGLLNLTVEGGIVVSMKLHAYRDLNTFFGATKIAREQANFDPRDLYTLAAADLAEWMESDPQLLKEIKEDVVSRVNFVPAEPSSIKAPN